ncbi:MAG: DUF2715 domain-containing protein [Treponema sp.]
MKKYFIVLFLFCISFISLFSIETIISPTIGYTNYFSYTGYKERSLQTHLHTVSMGLDLMFVGEESCFTVFANNAISFMEETQVYGDIDFIAEKGASVIEGMLWNTSILVGYTLDFTEDLKLRLGVGLGLFHGYRPKANTATTAIGSVVSISFDYFFIHRLGISFGIEDGVYGSIRKPLPNERLKVFNRAQTKLALVMKF